MKKVIAGIAGLFFALFGIGVIGLLISLTYSALGRLFPDNFENQMWGLVLFDIATIAWALAFVFKSKSAGQYVAAGAGFIVGFVGTIGMVAAEVILSSASLTGKVDTAQIGQWMVYGFIIATIAHVALIYTHHGADPEINQQISTGIARGEVIDKAMKDAVKQLDVEKAALAQAITMDIVSQVKRDLQLTPIAGTVFEQKRAETEAPRLTEPVPYPIEAEKPELPWGMYDPNDPNQTPFQSSRPEVHKALVEDAKAEKEPGETPAPFLKASGEE